jgi:hypothetical protein
LPIQENIKWLRNMKPQETREDYYLSYILSKKLNQCEIDLIVKYLLSVIN